MPGSPPTRSVDEKVDDNADAKGNRTGGITKNENSTSASDASFVQSLLAKMRQVQLLHLDEQRTAGDVSSNEP